MQAAPTLPMTVPTQDEVGWTWLSHHGIAPAPPRGTPTPASACRRAVPWFTQGSSDATLALWACVGGSTKTTGAV